jgi:arylsulfatase A-like enzyme
MLRFALILLPVILTTACPLLIADEPRSSARQKPNVVLIMCDDLGWGDVGFNGNRVIRTRNLDAMAKSGMVLTRFYSASAVCSPTRASCVTGRNPYRIGIPTANSGHMKPEELTLAELLKKLGYTTGHFGKWHLGTLTKTVVEANRGGPRGAEHYSPPQDNGFDVCFSTESKVPTYDPMLKPATNVSSKGWDYIRDRSSAVQYNTHYWDHHGKMVTDNLEGDDSRIIMDRAMPFIEGAVKVGKPFFAIVWFHTPHLPVVCGPEHAKMYAQYDSYQKNYYGCVTAMDEQVGRLRATLKELGVAKNTLVTFCSDNGPEGKAGSAPGTAGPFRGRKRDLFEGGIRVPGIIEWPAVIKPGSSTDFPAVTSDYLPTVLDIVGIEMPDQRPLDGISLVPVFAGKLKQRPSPIGFEFGGKVALTDNRYKLLKTRGRGNRREGSSGYMLFDLLADPGETHDIAADHPDVVQQMATTLEAWRQSCRASGAGDDYR